MRMKIDIALEICLSSPFLFSYSSDPLSVGILLKSQIMLLIINRRGYKMADKIRIGIISRFIPCISFLPYKGRLTNPPPLPNVTANGHHL